MLRARGPRGTPARTRTSTATAYTRHRVFAAHGAHASDKVYKKETLKAPQSYFEVSIGRIKYSYPFYLWNILQSPSPPVHPLLKTSTAVSVAMDFHAGHPEAAPNGERRHLPHPATCRDEWDFLKGSGPSAPEVSISLPTAIFQTCCSQVGAFAADLVHAEICAAEMLCAMIQLSPSSKSLGAVMCMGSCCCYVDIFF